MKVLPLALAALVAGTAVPFAAKAETDTTWYSYANLEFTCAATKKEGCPAHPANAYNPFFTHRQSFLLDTPDSEKSKYTFERTVNAGKEVCGKVGWQTNHMGWVPQGNAQVLTKWKENHSGTSCKRVGEIIQTVKKPVWMLAYSRNGKPVASALYADGDGMPMAKAGNSQFTSHNMSPWMGHEVCQNPKSVYGTSSLGPVGRMVNGHGYATLVTGERVPATSFMVSYVDLNKKWLPPLCEVVRFDLRYAPEFQNKFAAVTTRDNTPSGSTLVHQDY
jgi:hypothetical protein